MSQVRAASMLLPAAHHDRPPASLSLLLNRLGLHADAVRCAPTHLSVWQGQLGQGSTPGCPTGIQFAPPGFRAAWLKPSQGNLGAQPALPVTQ